MTTPSNVSEFPGGPHEPAPPVISPTRPLYWSVRRELGENRFIYIAPLIVMAAVLFATLIHTFGLPRTMRMLETAGEARQHAVLVKPFSIAPAPIMLATFLVGFFYSLDALYGERRDRSILFWKSMPISDVTTVLSKASIPLIVLPGIAFVLGVVTLFILLFQSTAILLISGLSPLPLWSAVHFFQEPLIMLYGLAVHSLWFAPLYCWLLLVSAWAPRATLLWAVLPLLAIAAVEKIAFNTMHFLYMLQYRIGGAMKEAFAPKSATANTHSLEHITQLSVARFLSAPGLWIGLALAAVFLALAIHLRRHRDPI